MLLRRYAPAVIIAVGLLLAIALAPSRGVSGGTGAAAYPAFDATGATPPAYGSSASGVSGTTGGASAVGSTGTSSGPASSGPVSGGGSTGSTVTAPGATTPSGTTGGTGASRPNGGLLPTGAATTGSATGKTTPTKTTAVKGGKAGGAPTTSGPGAAGVAGDTSHCVNGKQFGGFVSAPPCQPAWGGGNNGGATYAGVTNSTIEIVYYREADSPAVKAIEQQYGVYADPANQSAFAALIQKFGNSHYEFYGRKIHVDFVQSPGGCSTSPPDETCFRGDADAIVAQYHPFAVFFDDSTNTPFFFDELSKKGVINFGGWVTSDSFNTQHRPYHYDYFTGGDTQAAETAGWYCKRLANQNATFAGDPTYRQAKRKVGVLVQDVDINVSPAQHLAQLIDQCDSNGAQVFTYSPDTGNSQEQAVTLVSKMKAAGITTVIYFCDPIAPVFFTASETSQNYQPENMIAGSDLSDYDSLAQSYDATQWKHAFGLSDSGDAENISKTEAQAVYTAAGGSGTLYAAGNLPWDYLSQIMAGLQQAGPMLNPGTFERGMLTLPATGGDRYDPLIQYGNGDYTGISDYREVYWDPTVTSPYDNKAGAYVSLNNGARVTVGHEPNGVPSFPAGV